MANAFGVTDLDQQKDQVMNVDNNNVNEEEEEEEEYEGK
jgi:hypothetical protein